MLTPPPQETINILYSLEPLEFTKQEGITKVQDGGRCGRIEEQQ